MATERIASNADAADSSTFSLAANSSLRVFSSEPLKNNEYVWLLFNDGTRWRPATELLTNGIVCSRDKQYGVITNPSSASMDVRLRKSATSQAMSVSSE